MKTVAYVAGKSGGHLIPAITHAQNLRQEQSVDRIVFFTSTAPLDAHITQNASGIDQTIQLPSLDVPGKKIWNYPLFLVKEFLSFWHAGRLLHRARPECVISMGGSISIPVCIAARLLGIPFDLYELNVEPGKAVSFLSPWARNIFICFEETRHYFKQKKCVLTTYPIRYSRQFLPPRIQNSTHKTVFILGGSQGSVFINNLIHQWIEKNQLPSTLSLVHQTGARDRQGWNEWYQHKGITAHVFDFEHDLATYYQSADLIICRAGAGTLAEIIFFQKPCITIPLEIPATSHQLHNAHAYARKYPALVHVMRTREIQQNIAVFFEKMRSFLQ